MSIKQLSIVSSSGNYSSELPDDVPLRTLLPSILQRLNLPIADNDGRHIPYRLSSLSTGRELPLDGTIKGVNFASDDALVISYSLKAGGHQSDSILGLSTSELAGLSVAELTGNETAIKMMMHYYKQVVDENNSLKNDNNTLRTYVSAYDKQKSNSATGAVLLAVSNVPIGFGVNLITSANTVPGLFSLIVGIVLTGAGIYFNFFKDRE